MKPIPEAGACPSSVRTEGVCMAERAESRVRWFWYLTIYFKRVAYLDRVNISIAGAPSPRVSSEPYSAWLDIQRLSGGLRAFFRRRRMARRPAGPRGCSRREFCGGESLRLTAVVSTRSLRRTLVCGGAISSWRRRSDHLSGIQSIRFAVDSIAERGIRMFDFAGVGVEQALRQF